MSFKKTVITLSIGTALGFGVFYGKEVLNNVKVEANFQKTLENMEKSKVDLNIVLNSLRSKINEYATYKVSDSTVTIKCFNEYKEGVEYVKNIFTGKKVKNPFNKSEDWVLCEPTVWTYAQADASFYHEIAFANSVLSVDNNKIIVDVEYPYLNNKSISVDMKTYKELESETINGNTYKNGMNQDAQMLDMQHNMKKNNNSSIKANARTAWQVKYIDAAPAKINEVYLRNDEKRAELEANTVKSVKNLLDSLLVDVLKSLDIVDENVELEVRIRK